MMTLTDQNDTQQFNEIIFYAERGYNVTQTKLMSNISFITVFVLDPLPSTERSSYIKSLLRVIFGQYLARKDINP